MKKLLFWRLLIPLLILSIISLILAYKSSGSLDLYANIFLNLATDFFMVIVTVYYIDKVLKDNEDRRWDQVNFSIGNRIAAKINPAIGYICKALGADKLIPEIYPKLYNPRGTPDTIHYLYFIHELEKRPGLGFNEEFVQLFEADKENILKQIESCSAALNEFLTFYSSHLPPELLLAIVDAQESIRLFYHEGNKDCSTVLIILQGLAKVIDETKIFPMKRYIKFWK